VPPQVTIPAGALFADVPVMANAVGSATITASLNGGSASSTVSVAPAELVSLALAPQTPTRDVGEAVPFTATGTMTDGTSEDFTSRATWTSSSPAVATINATGVASALAAGQTTIRASFSFTAVQTGQPVTINSSTTLAVRQAVALVLTATTTNLQVAQSAIVTVSSSDPAPAGGLIINLAGSGTGAGSFPATVSIPEGGTAATFLFTATASGQLTLTATAQNRLPGSITFTIAPQFAITGFTPTTGPIGTAVAIAGVGFDPNLSGNQVKFNGEPAVIVSGNATLLNAIVPPRATTGAITVTNVRGTATSATSFTVQEREAFDITLAPASLQVPPGGNGGTRVRLSSTGLNPYPYGATVAITGLPAGVTATFDRPMVALNLDSIVTFNAAAGASPSTFNVTLTATGASGVRTQVVTKTLTLQVLAAGGTTVTGRVFHADDDAPFVGARVRLGGQAVFTDETGTYRFINPTVLGDQVLLIDGNTANTAQFEFPSGIAMPVMIAAGQDNKVLTSYIGRVDATKFTAIVPGQAASVTDADIPNFSLNIPAGVTIIGWDGQPVTKVNVRKVPIDRLPIRPIPDGQTSKSVYLFYFFREGGGDPTQPIPVSIPNDLDALPGEQVELWYYDESRTPDPSSNQWRLMGIGTVSADGKMVVSNPGVGIPKFCCGAVRLVQRVIGAITGAFGGNGCGPTSNSPVDLASGNALVFRPRPFGMSKFMAVNPNCQYRSTDPRQGVFGRGMSFTYDWFAEPAGSEAMRVANPQGVVFLLSREADGVFRARDGRSGAIEMEVTPTASGRTLRLADGTRYEFNPAGQLVAVVDLAGNRTSFQLNAQGFPLAMTDAAGQVYRFDLIPGNPPLVSRITDPAGRYLEFGYDGSRRLVTYRDQGGGITAFEYDANNRIVKKTDPRGAIETIEYDAAGRAVKEVLPAGGIQQFGYALAGTVLTETRHTDENGNATTYRWNGLGYLSRVTDAVGRITSYGLDTATNRVRQTIDPAGRLTQYTYNQRGDLIRVIDPENNQTLIDYDLRFRKPVRIQNALGHVVTLEYNSQGNLTKFTNAELETTSFTYTAKGQLETVTDALNRVARFTYDLNGNLIESTNAAGEITARLYDAANRLTELIDPNNRSTAFTYDALDRVAQVRDGAFGLSTYAYDANDNLTSVTDPNNNPVERNVYDLRNRLVQKTDAKNLSTAYSYDAAGNLIRLTDRKLQVTEYSYDALNRVTQIRDHDGRITSYAYDLASNLARISDSLTGDILLSYDKLDRLTEVVTPQGTVAYTYDAIGRRLTRTVSGGDVTAYTYDKANRLTTVTLRGNTATYSYDAAGRLIEKVLPNGLKATHQYDAADRVTSIAYTKPQPAPAAPVAVETISYGYDVAGQRIQKGVGAGSLQETPFSATYDAANRLASITLRGELFTLSYDANGNLISKSGPTSGTTTYNWNARNELVGLSGPSGTASFTYDALGRRIEKTVNGVTTGFLYDGAQAIAELKGTALDTVYHTGIAIDEVLARYGASGDKTLLIDALMSVIVQANDDQSIANFYAYSSYGEVATLGPDGGNPLQYTGRENDGTGLYYYRARYYDPVMKRFISEDPIGLVGGMNVYAYVRGDPLRFSDPLGFSPIWDWLSEHGSVDLTFNAGTGVVGATGQISVTKSGVSGYVGLGWGIGFGASLTGGANFGSSSGWGITGSVSGGKGAGATASGTISECGASANVGVGLGVGAGASVTLGYGGTIWSW
jgi:RHS repeat-associated protein